MGRRKAAREPLFSGSRSDASVDFSNGAFVGWMRGSRTLRQRRRGKYHAKAGALNGVQENRHPLRSRKIAIENRLEAAKWTVNDPHMLSVVEGIFVNLHQVVNPARTDFRHDSF